MAESVATPVILDCPTLEPDEYGDYYGNVKIGTMVQILTAKGYYGPDFAPEFEDRFTEVTDNGCAKYIDIKAPSFFGNARRGHYFHAVALGTDEFETQLGNSIVIEVTLTGALKDGDESDDDDFNYNCTVQIGQTVHLMTSKGYHLHYDKRFTPITEGWDNIVAYTDCAEESPGFFGNAWWGHYFKGVTPGTVEFETPKGKVVTIVVTQDVFKQALLPAGFGPCVELDASTLPSVLAGMETTCDNSGRLPPLGAGESWVSGLMPGQMAGQVPQVQNDLSCTLKVGQMYQVLTAKGHDPEYDRRFTALTGSGAVTYEDRAEADAGFFFNSWWGHYFTASAPGRDEFQTPGGKVVKIEVMAPSAVPAVDVKLHAGQPLLEVFSAAVTDGAEIPPDGADGYCIKRGLFWPTHEQDEDSTS